MSLISLHLVDDADDADRSFDNNGVMLVMTQLGDDDVSPSVISIIIISTFRKPVAEWKGPHCSELHHIFTTRYTAQTLHDTTTHCVTLSCDKIQCPTTRETNHTEKSTCVHVSAVLHAILICHVV